MTSNHNAIKALLKYGVNELPITFEKLKKIINDKNWSLIAFDDNSVELYQLLKEIGMYEKLKDKKGFTISVGEYKAVCYRTNLSSRQRTQVVAHELGHIEAGHFSDTGILGLNYDSSLDDPQEEEAIHFARNLLIPVCVLKEMHISTSDEIERYTNVEHALARQQLLEINQLKIPTPLEQDLILNFSAYIDKVKLKPKKQKTIIRLAIITTIIVLSAGILKNVVQEETLYYNGTTESSITLVTQPLPPEQNAISLIKTEKSMLVYYIPGRDVFHLPTCHYIRDKSELLELALDEARQKMLRPCKYCLKEYLQNE